jgi:alkylhydroperoxidase/carboxymuconolactone decarboxylase family protein YurZ
MAVTSTRGCIACTGSRIKKALEAGVPYDTIIAGIDLASAVNAGTTVAIATQGADLNKIDEICSDGICTTGLPE